MSREITRKKLKQDEFVEAAFNVEQWFERHWKVLARWGAGVLALVLLVTAWAWWSAKQREQAQVLLGQGLTALREGDVDTTKLDEALALFEESAGKADAAGGWVARYYQGVTLVRKSDYQGAIDRLEGLAGEAPEPSSHAAAKTLLARAYAATGRADDAIDTLRSVADGGAGFAAQALIDLAAMHREAGRSEEARSTLEEIGRRFPQSASAAEADRLLQQLGS